MAISSIPEFYTDVIDEQGTTKRVRFFCRVELLDGSQAWHYFGVDPADRPPPPPFDALPVFEYGLVQFPQSLDDLTGQEANDFLYEIGRVAGFRREGLTSP